MGDCRTFQVIQSFLLCGPSRLFSFINIDLSRLPILSRISRQTTGYGFAGGPEPPHRIHLKASAPHMEVHTCPVSFSF